MVGVLPRAGMNMVSRLAALLLAVVVLASAGGCASGGPKKPPTGTPEPDKFLFDRGNENIAKKRWIVSREYFRQLVDSYPQSQYRADAKLGIGDSYMGEKSSASYVLAINEYREFLSFYPTHTRADYAQYQLGMGYFKQMRSAMRDQIGNARRDPGIPDLPDAIPERGRVETLPRRASSGCGKRRIAWTTGMPASRSSTSGSSGTRA